MVNWLLREALTPLVLRLGVGWIFIYQGLVKVLRTGNQWGMAWYKGAEMPELPGIMQMIVAWGELLGGIAVALGFLTRLGASGLGAIMIGAIVTITRHHGFSIITGEGNRVGYDYNLALLTICAALLLMGAGPVSLDRLLFPPSVARKERTPG